ncbi:hypothetical protein [Parvibaculum sp. MBR-TMA-1.3b-4.2]|jgi:hypothetical protein
MSEALQVKMFEVALTKPGHPEVLCYDAKGEHICTLCLDRNTGRELAGRVYLGIGLDDRAAHLAVQSRMAPGKGGAA